MTLNHKYLAVAVAVFAAHVLYHQWTLDERMLVIEDAVVAIADDVQSIKQAVVVEPLPTVIKYTEQEFDCLARNIFYEAGVEDRAGKVAVAQVTLNRLRTGYWGSDICKVVYAPAQFSWTRIKKRAWLQIEGPLWEESQQVAVEVLDQGTRIAALNTSLFYHADYIKDPYWVDRTKLTTKVGRHIFYAQAKGSTLKL